jgi:alanyl-tRNA synthetase
LNGVPVIDVQALDDGGIVHVLEREVEGTAVRGEVDWKRRFDHMQQHTGQHILSQAFVSVCQAETVSFHLGQDASTIDLNQAPLSVQDVGAAERLANETVMGAYSVHAQFVRESALADLPVRKMPTVDGSVRIVQIDEFDWSPCGGTHVVNTGQVGPIKVVRVERRKDESRIYFVCGWRALADYAQKQELVQSLATRFTTAEDEILASVERLEAGIKDAQKALTEAQMNMLDCELPTWNTIQVGGVRVVQRSFVDRDTGLLREAARRLTEEEGTIALLGSAQPHPQFVFASSDDVAADMGELMRAACAAVGGKGGGRSNFAQGGAPVGASLERAFSAALECIE